MKKFALALMLVLTPACTKESATREALDDMGFTDVQTGGYSVFGCGKGYTFHTKFTARNPHNKFVSGVVCCGVLTGCAVKF